MLMEKNNSSIAHQQTKEDMVLEHFCEQPDKWIHFLVLNNKPVQSLAVIPPTMEEVRFSWTP